MALLNSLTDSLTVSDTAQNDSVLIHQQSFETGKGSDCDDKGNAVSLTLRILPEDEIRSDDMKVRSGEDLCTTPVTCSTTEMEP